jgi:hypothetical protein
LWRSSVSFTSSINSRTRLPRFDAGHEHGKQTNEFAAHEQLRSGSFAWACSGYRGNFKNDL